jgi:leucyl aminopeptidase
MKIELIGSQAALPERAVLAIVTFEDKALQGAASELDVQTGGALGRAASAARFTGAKGQTLDLLAPAGVAADRLLLVGAGKSEAFDDLAAETAAAAAYQAMKTSGATTLRVVLPAGAIARTARAALGVRLAAYRFDRYRTKEAADKKPTLVKAQIATDAAQGAPPAVADFDTLADAVAFARDLVSEPGNILHPEEFAARVKGLETLGLEVEILGEAQMAKLGMGSLLGVGQGSRRESQLVVIKWLGASDKSAQPLAFVGKGVTFDTGGISLKPGEGMEEMKWDMGGAAAVAGLMHALAGRKAKVNAIGVLGLVENMPDGNAQRPGDVVTSMSGQTIEVINTDAEGRLVLADALWYCQDRFKPKFMVDLATLTGAIVMALGPDFGGLFSNDDQLAADLLAAGTVEGEPLWRMPLPAAYDKSIDSKIADVKNLGPRPGGSVTAALFLQRFVNGLPWAHLDIAAVAWKQTSTAPTHPEGATGFGVRLLNRLVADKYESA